MKKKTSFSTQGKRADLGLLTIQRMLPNRYADKVGPFVFLDYVAPAIKEMISKDGMGAHPHCLAAHSSTHPKPVKECA